MISRRGRHPRGDIHIRDPFVLPLPDEGRYLLFGTTDGKNAWSGPGLGFDCYSSRDLEEWEGPVPAFRQPPGFWATMNFWAPEVYAYGGRFFMFASFKAPCRYRGTQILAADAPEGPYLPLTDGPVTPPDWECLDGTLYVDKDSVPWIVFCQEWVQVHNGSMWAMRLAPDLRAAAGRPVFLFNASEAPWKSAPSWPAENDSRRFPTYVTDGPFLYRTRTGVLLMLWSSFGAGGYAIGIARSENGRIEGPWRQDKEPLYSKDGGHSMLFRSLDGRLMLALHGPNRAPDERAQFIEVEDDGQSIKIK